MKKKPNFSYKVNDSYLLNLPFLFSYGTYDNQRNTMYLIVYHTFD